MQEGSAGALARLYRKEKMRIHRLIILLLALVLIASAASCEVHFNAEKPAELEKPADWEQRDLLRLTVLEFKGNDAMLLEVGGKKMLIDGGVRDKFKKRMNAWLERMDLKHVDVLFNTHPDRDHLEMMTYLVRNDLITADEFMSPYPEDSRNENQMAMVPELRAHGIPYHQLQNGDEFDFGGAHIRVYTWAEGSTPNDKSAIFHITYGNATMLLTGDMTGRTAHWLIDNYPADELKADIMKAPHHGITQMVHAFFMAVNPEFVFVTNTTGNTPALNEQLKRHVVYTHHSRGTIYLETDGTDWYITQKYQDV